MLRQATLAEVRYRILEISEWVQDFIYWGDAEQAARWARELVRISRQLEPGYPVADYVKDEGY